MEENQSFYADGLHFSCTRCSACCRHEPGYVFLSKTDVVRLAEAFSISPEKFVDIYCRAIDIGGFSRISLNEKKNYDCIFWEGEGCSVYDYRPLQCVSYPFWSSNLISKENWDELASSCPGINKGERYSLEEIRRFLDQRLREPLL